MDLPFALTENRDGTLHYGLALWYRTIATGVFGILAWTLVSEGRPPSVLGWLLLALAALGALYEEKWIFGPDGVTHAVGLVFASRGKAFTNEDLESLRIVPHVRGTIPGSADETRENARALSGGDEAGAPGKTLLSWKKPFLLLVLAARDGAEYAIDKVPARRREYLTGIARRISSLSGIPLD